MRLDELADWCLLETARRDPDLAGRLRTMKFQRHAIDRVVDWARHKDWAMLDDKDYWLLLDRYVPAMKQRYGKYHVQVVWNPYLKMPSSLPADIMAAKGIAYFLMDQKQMKLYRKAVRGKK